MWLLPWMLTVSSLTASFQDETCSRQSFKKGDKMSSEADAGAEKMSVIQINVMNSTAVYSMKKFSSPCSSVMPVMLLFLHHPAISFFD